MKRAASFTSRRATTPPTTRRNRAAPAWTAELCESAVPAERARDKNSSRSPGAISCSARISGVVVAIDATTGKRSWGFRYPRSRKAVNHPTGDPAPGR